MQAGVTCNKLFINYTAWKWQLEKKNHDLVPELVAYTLTQSFSYASHQCGHDSLSPIHNHIYGYELETKNRNHIGWNSALERRPQVRVPGRGSSPVATFKLCS